jgi:hypothetical protein
LEPGSATEYAAQFIGASAIGGVSGGITETMTGGSFGHGFVEGGKTAGIGYLANNVLHKVIMTVQGAMSFT